MSLGRSAALEPARDRHQQLVADVVAERVVDDLEAVEVEEQHGRAAVGWRRWARRIAWSRRSRNSTRFGQAGQRVVQRVVLQALLGLAAVGDVGLAADDARRAAVRGRAPRSPRASIQR